MRDLPDFPGGDLVKAGLEDLRAGELSTSALLVLVGAPRLRLAGLAVPDLDLGELPEHLLYQRLVAEGVADPYSAYNAYLRRLVSFESAYEQFGEVA